MVSAASARAPATTRMRAVEPAAVVVSEVAECEVMVMRRR